MSELQWTENGLKELVEDLLELQPADGQLQPLLLLAAEDNRQTVVPLEAILFTRPRFVTATLPQLVRDFGPSGATRAAFVSSQWTVAFDPGDLKASHAYRLHRANGGTLSTWPGREEAVVMYVVEQGAPSWAIVGLVERHPDGAPRIREWDVSDVAERGPIVAALEKGVGGAN
jgi:hypothetical protein